MRTHSMMPRALALLALVFSVLLCSAGAQTVVATNDTQLVDDVPEYQGSVGPDSIFYGLTLALENLDEAFTSNETARMEKMMVHAQIRISETKTMLKYQQFTSADRAMEAYQEKLKQTSGELDRTVVNEADLIPVQKTMFKYHTILQDLHSDYPDISNLADVLNESTAVQDQFTERTQMKIQEKSVGSHEMVMVKVQVKEKNKSKGKDESITETPTATPSPEETGTVESAVESTETPDGQQPGEGLGQDKDKEKNKPKGKNGSITETPTATPSPTETETAEPTIVQSTQTTDDQKPGKGLGRDKDKDADADGNGKGSDNSDKNK